MADLQPHVGVPPDPGPASPPSSRRPLRPALIGLIPLGIAVAAVGLGVLTTAGAGIRTVVVVAGAVGAFAGLDALLEVVRGHRVDTGLWLATAWLVVVVLAAVSADLLPLAESLDQSRTLTEIPRLRPDLLSEHPLGTDKQALDVLGGVIYGARISLQVSLSAVAIGTVVGGLIGVVAGYFGGRVDSLIGVMTDSLLAFPPLILLLAVVAVIDAGVLTISLALAALTVPTYIRLARANTLTFAQREFVLSARAMGAKDWRIIAFELVPNVIRPVLSYGFIIIAVLIVAEASLSFLGVGIQPPTPTWGNMIASGGDELERTPHLVFAPGTVMFLTVFALNRLGDKARELYDPSKGPGI